MGWVKLQRGQDWALHFWCLPGTKTAALPLVEDINVRWPDGTQTAEDVFFRDVFDQYADHEQMHVTVVRSKLAILHGELYGAPVTVEMDAVEVLAEEWGPEGAPRQRWFRGRLFDVVAGESDEAFKARALLGMGS